MKTLKNNNNPQPVDNLSERHNNTLIKHERKALGLMNGYKE